LVPVLVGVAMVAAVISSLGAPLIPDVARSLRVSLDSAQWSLTAALLSGAVAAPIMGRLGDGARRREVIIAGLAIVFAGSIIAGAARSLPVLVLGRTMQGAGIGLAPLTMAAARDHLPDERGSAVIAILSVAGAAGVGIGYPVSGLIAQDLSVHAAFLFGALMSGIALVASLLVIPSSQASRSMPFDANGAFVGAIGLTALLLAIGLIIVALLVLLVWARGQLRREAPLVALHELRRRAVLTANIAALILGMAMYMFLTLITEFVQAPRSAGYGFGASTLVAGLCLVPFSVTSLSASRTIGPLMNRFGSAAVLVGGTLTIAVAGAFFALEHTTLLEAFVTMGVIGIGFGYTFAAIPGLITRAVPAHETGSAMGLYQVIRYVGFALGSALSASILASHIGSGHALPSAQGYVTGLWTGAGICALSAAGSWLLGAGAAAPPADAMPASESARLIRDEAELASAGLAALDSERPPR
jgi:MFS family permease